MCPCVAGVSDGLGHRGGWAASMPHCASSLEPLGTRSEHTNTAFPDARTVDWARHGQVHLDHAAVEVLQIYNNSQMLWLHVRRWTYGAVELTAGPRCIGRRVKHDETKATRRFGDLVVLDVHCSQVKYQIA